MQKTVALEMRGVSKYFGPVAANKGVNLTVYQGEILSILGENGSGKTTLMNMISGIYYPDEGQIFIGGEEVVIRSPKDAFKYKIGMIHQHFKLVDVFTAAQNVVLGIEDEKYSIKKVNARVTEIAEKYGFHIDPKKKIYDMAVSEKQTVEIIKVLYRGADILILDEPTAVLTPQETEKLFAVLRRMKEDGKSIIIITHKLHEVLSLSDRVAVLRKGEYIGTVETKTATESSLTEMMVGEKVELNIQRTDPVDPQDRLTVKNLSCVNREGVKVLDNVTFTARSGEILGIAGIAGSGQRELLEAIAGLQKLESGDMIFRNPKKDKPVTFFHKDMRRVKELAKAGAFHYEDGTAVDFTRMSTKQIKRLVNEGKVLFNEDEIIDLKDKKPRQIRELAKAGAFHYEDGTPVDFTGMPTKEIKRLVNEGKVLFNEDEIIDLKHKTPLQIRELGIRLSFVPEDRLGMGLVGNMDLIDNMMLRSYRKGKGMFLDRKKPERLAEEIVASLEVATPSTHTPVRRLSGGNVQKVLVGREIAAAPKVLMAAYPVRGLDINSSYTIYNLLNKQKENGTAVIFVGEDLDVLIELCDRILVIGGGKVTGVVDGRGAKKEEIGLLMTKTEAATVEETEIEEVQNG